MITCLVFPSECAEAEIIICGENYEKVHGKSYEECLQAVNEMDAGNPVTEDPLTKIASLRTATDQFYSIMAKYLLELKDDPFWKILVPSEDVTNESFHSMFAEADKNIKVK